MPVVDWLESDNGTTLVRKLVTNSYLAATSTVSSTRPINTVRPALDNASPIVGDTITADEGTWENSPTSFAWLWFRDNISTGITTESYTVTTADCLKTLKRRTIASNMDGNSFPVFSNTSDIVPFVSSDTSLSTLTVEGQSVANGGTVQLANSYEGDEITDLTIVATPTDAGATVGVKSITPSPLVVSDGNVLEFDVTASDGVTTEHYSISLVLAPATPTGFSVSGGSNPGEVQWSFDDTLPNITWDLHQGPDSNFANASLLVAGTISGGFTSVGNGVSAYYFLIATYLSPASDPSIPTAGVFATGTPSSVTAFTIDGTPYNNEDTVNLENGTPSVSVAATDGGNITNLVGDSGLLTGDNVCTFTVVAQDGVTTLDVTINLHVLTAAVAETTDYDFTGLDGTSFVTGSEGKSLMTILDEAAHPGETERFFWFRVDGVETIPDLSASYPNATEAFFVDLLSTDTDSDSAEAFRAAFVDAFGGNYTISRTGSVVTATSLTPGSRPDAFDINSSVVITVTTQGQDPV